MIYNMIQGDKHLEQGEQAGNYLCRFVYVYYLWIRTVFLIHGGLSVMKEKDKKISPYDASFLEKSLWQFWQSLTKS